MTPSPYAHTEQPSLMKWDGLAGFIIKVFLIASTVMVGAIKVYGLATTDQIDRLDARVDTVSAGTNAIRSDLDQLKLIGCLGLQPEQRNVVNICRNVR